MKLLNLHSRFVLIMLMSLFTPLSNAQDDTHPLLEMLSFLPNTELLYPNTFIASYPIISYVDYEAVQMYSAFGTVINDFATFDSLSEDEQQAWILAFQERYSATRQLVMPNEGIGKAVNVAFGFDYFAINQEMQFGVTPDNGRIFGIDYDLDAVDSALQTHGYTSTEQDGIIVWCQRDTGCDETPFRENIEPENIFDDQFGRKPPIVAATGYLYSPFSSNMLQQMVATRTDSIIPIGKVPHFQVLAESIIDQSQIEGDLVGAFIMFGSILYKEVELETLAELYGVLDNDLMPKWSGNKTIPEPQLVAFADKQSDSGRTILMAILYEDGEQARESQAELERRVHQFSYEAVADSELLIDIVDAEVTPLDSYIYTDDLSGIGVVVIPFEVGQVTEKDRKFYNDVLVFLWYYEAQRRTFYPLWNVSLPE